MKKILQGIVVTLFLLYFIGFSLSATYFNWQYAREHGFVKWLLLGEVISTAKAFVWPYFIFVRVVEHNQSEISTTDIDQAQINNTLLQGLQLFMLKDAVVITDHSRSDAQKYLENKSFKLIVSRKHKQEKTTEDVYLLSNATIESPVKTVSLFSFGEQEFVRLFVVAIPQRYRYLAEQYIKNALDSTDAGKGKIFQRSKLYFIGIHRIGPLRVLKISIREDTLPQVKIYSIYYISSEE